MLSEPGIRGNFPLSEVMMMMLLLNLWAQLNVQSKPVEPLVEGGAQIQQVLNIECLTDFCDAPLLNIKFR